MHLVLVIFVVAYLTIGHAQVQECDKQDVLFIYEHQIDSRGNQQLELLHQVFNNLKESLCNVKTKDRCLRNKLSLLVQSEGADLVQPFDCDEQCVQLSQMTLDGLARNYRKRRGKTKPEEESADRAWKSEIAATLSQLDRIFPKSGVGALPKRMVVLMLTTPLDETLKRAIAVLPNRISVLVVGIWKGATEDMERLVRETHQYMAVQSIGEILPGKSGFQVISDLIKDINYNDNNVIKECDQLSFNVQGDTSFRYLKPFQCKKGKPCFNQAEKRFDDFLGKFPTRTGQLLSFKYYIAHSEYSKQLQNINKIFGVEAGGRSEAEKILVLMLTSALDDSLKAAIEGLPEDYTVLVVGILDGAEEEMEQLVKHSHQFVMVQDMKEVLKGSAGYNVLSKLVNDPTYNRFKKENMLRAEPPCNIKADIAFIIDASLTINSEYFALLQFVKYIITSFGVSEEGSHYGAIVFSDTADLAFKFNEEYDLEKLVTRIERLPYEGGKTRIDLAINLANTDLFQPSGGARQDVEKIVFMLTDGDQQPKMNPSRTITYDPYAAAGKLQLRGYKIYVMAIGNKLTPASVERIVSASAHIFTSATATELLDLNLVKNITSSICDLQTRTTTTKPPTTTTTESPTTTTTTTEPPTTTTTEPPITTTTKPPTTTTTKPPTTTTTKLPTTTTTTTKPPITTTIKPTTTTSKPTINISEPERTIVTDAPSPKCPGIEKCSQCCNPQETFINIFQSGSSQRSSQQELLNSLKSMLSRRRNRRSVDGNKDKLLFATAKAAGCNLFLHDAMRFLNENYMNKSRNVLFCPKASYQAFLTEVKPNKVQLKNIILNHLTKKVGNSEMMYKSHLNGEMIDLKSTTINDKLHYKVNDANLKLCMSHGAVGICVIEKVLQPITLTLMDVLRETKNLTIMSSLAQEGSFKELLTHKQDVKKICFGKGMCLPVVGKTKSYFNDLIRAKQFTIQLLGDGVFLQMNPTQLTSLKTDKTVRRNFLLQHIFVGIVQHGNEENDSRLIAQSAQQGHPVSELLWSDGKPVVSEANGLVYVVDRSIRVREGLVQILRRIE